jgi:hypothetical protein
MLHNHTCILLPCQCCATPFPLCSRPNGWHPHGHDDTEEGGDESAYKAQGGRSLKLIGTTPFIGPHPVLIDYINWLRRHTVQSWAWYDLWSWKLIYYLLLCLGLLGERGPVLSMVWLVKLEIDLLFVTLLGTPGRARTAKPSHNS